MKKVGSRGSRFLFGFIVASLIFGTASFALSVNNTPEGGYLLCYNTSTKVVTFPGNLKCPKNTKPLELGAQGFPGQDGTDGEDGRNGLNGRDGINGRDGLPGKDGSQAITFNAYLKEQDIVVTDTSKGKRVIVLKASDLVNATSVPRSFKFDAKVDVYFPSITTSNSNKFAGCTWRDSSDWQTTDKYYGHSGYAQISGTNWTGEPLYASAVLSVSTLADKYLTCHFYGTGQVTSGYVTATETTGYFQGTLGGS